MSLTTSALKGRNFEAEIRRFIEDSQLSEDQRATLKAFLQELSQGKLSLSAQRTYAFVLRNLGRYLKKPYKKASRDLGGALSRVLKEASDNAYGIAIGR
jgi:hypothetical protein